MSKTMRQIKFRGLRLDGKGWVYGDLVHTVSVSNGVSKNHTLIGEDLDLIEVHPESVGQFTGLKDKNGKEIYGGDILHSNAYHRTWIAEFTPCDGLKIAIKYEDNFKLEGVVQTHEDWSYNKVSTCKIIGNIHENK